MLTLKIKVIGYELELDRVSSFEFIWDLPFCLKNLLRRNIVERLMNYCIFQILKLWLNEN